MVHETTSDVTSSFDADKSTHSLEKNMVSNVPNVNTIVALFVVPLLSIEDLDVLTRKIKAGDYDEIKNGMTSVEWKASIEAIEVEWKKFMANMTSITNVPINEADEALEDSISMGIPLPEGVSFTKETVRVEYEWKPPRYEQCKIFGHVNEQFPKNEMDLILTAVMNNMDPNVRFDQKSHENSQKTNDGNIVHSASKEKPTKSANVSSTFNTRGSTKNRGLQYHSSASNIHTSNPFDALDDMESDEEVEINIPSALHRLAKSSDNKHASVFTYTSKSSASEMDNPWGIPLVNVVELPEMDPYEEVAQQGQTPPLSPAYIPDPMELDEHVLVYVMEPEHPEYHVLIDDDIQVDQPYADDASLTAKSPGHIADSDSIEDDSIDYPIA
ncbi:hypothetical protein Tco_0039101 [Tanacetum coccineum]